MTSPERSSLRQICYAALWLGLLPISLAMPWPQALKKPWQARNLIAVLLVFIGLFAACIIAIAMVLVASGRIPVS